MCALAPFRFSGHLVNQLLRKHRHLKSITVVNPVNRCPTVVVPVTKVERFDRQYVSLFALARQQRRHSGRSRRSSTLDQAGAEPTFNPKEIGATFHRRDDVGWRSRASVTSSPPSTSGGEVPGYINIAYAVLSLIASLSERLSRNAALKPRSTALALSLGVP